tara:strand:- start:48 stop:164 length:117 start_codon:yes stop_codon:yes gene_type:complete
LKKLGEGVRAELDVSLQILSRFIGLPLQEGDILKNSVD